jgi:hypothetical protein
MQWQVYYGPNLGSATWTETPCLARSILVEAIERWLVWNGCVGDVNKHNETILLEEPADWFKRD